MTTLGSVRLSRAAALFSGLIAACSVEDGVLGHLRAGAAGAAGADGASAKAGTESFYAAECAATSPTIMASGVPTCIGRVAAATFGQALCVCDGVQLGQGITTFGFDSALGGYMSTAQETDGGAAVGINGEYQTAAGYTDVAGSLSVAGPNDMSVVGFVGVRGDLRIAGNAQITGIASVSRNAWFAGTYVGWGPLTVQGELHHAQSVLSLPPAVGIDIHEPVTIPKPCPCDVGQQLNIEQLVGEARQQNVDEKFRIDPNVLAAVSDDLRLTLPCGAIYLSHVQGTGNVTLRVIGFTTVFVEDDLALDGDLQFELAAGAAVDLIVKGNLAVSGALTLAPQARPSAGRVFVGGTSDIRLKSTFVGNLYAPRARVFSVGNLEIYGSAFVGSFAGDAAAKLIYDRSISSVDSSCSRDVPMPGACSQCGSCTGGTACVEGICSACRTDIDCCGLNVCDGGRCTALIML